MATKSTLLEDSLLLIWNERDAAKRVQLMVDVYSSDLDFYERDGEPAITGFDTINALIGKLQSQWAPAFRFELTRPVAVNHQVQQISWKLGAPGEAPVATGMDIAIIENDRIRSLHLFLDQG